MNRSKMFRHEVEDLIEAKSCHTQQVPKEGSEGWEGFQKEKVVIEGWAEQFEEVTIRYQPEYEARYLSGWEVGYRPDAVVFADGMFYVVEVKGEGKFSLREAKGQAKVYKEIFLMAHPEIDPKIVRRIGLVG